MGNIAGLISGGAAAAEGLGMQKASNALQEQTAKASKNEEFRNNMVMSLLAKAASGKF
jgi:hypothetical protein